MDLHTVAAFLTAPFLLAGANLLRHAYNRMPLARIANVANQPSQQVVSGVTILSPNAGKPTDQLTKSPSSPTSSASALSLAKSRSTSRSQEPNPSPPKRKAQDDILVTPAKVPRSRSSAASKKPQAPVDSTPAKSVAVDPSSSVDAPAVLQSATKRSTRGTSLHANPAPVDATPATSATPKPRARKTDVQAPPHAPIEVEEEPERAPVATRTPRARKSAPAARTEAPLPPPCAEPDEVSTAAPAEAPAEAEEPAATECRFLHRTIEGLSVARHRAMLK